MPKGWPVVCTLDRGQRCALSIQIVYPDRSIRSQLSQGESHATRHPRCHLRGCTRCGAACRTAETGHTCGATEGRRRQTRTAERLPDRGTVKLHTVERGGDPGCA